MLKALAVLGMVYSVSGTWARAEQGRLSHDVTVGANHDVVLKSNLVVQVLKHSGGMLVIMAQAPDGSSGIYQIDASAVEITASGNASAPAPAATTTAPKTLETVAPPKPPPPPAKQPMATPPTPTVVAVPAEPPTYPNDFVGSPEVNTKAGRQSAGTASIVKLKDGFQSYIVSARHLLGPEGGFEKQTAAADVPAFVQSIEIESFSGGRHQYNVTGLLIPTQRLQADGGDPIDDMAIYQNHDLKPQDQAVALAETVPAVGDPVWVVARVRGGVPEGQIMQSGKVTDTSNWIIFQFDNDKIVTAGASGAPVLNAKGEVVGVYSGHSTGNGHVLGFAMPSPLLIKIIKQSSPADH